MDSRRLSPGRRASAIVVFVLAGCSQGGIGNEDLLTAQPTVEAIPTATAEPTEEPTPSPTPRPTPTPVAQQELIIVEHGFTFFPGDTPYLQYAVVFENTNAATWVADRTNVNMTWYDAAGAVAGSESTYLSLGLPGQRVAVAGVAFDVIDPVEMEVQFRVGDWTEVDFEPGSFTFEDVATQPQQFGGPVTRGLIVSSFEEDQELIQIVAVYKDANGTVLGGDSGYAEFVPAGGSIGFEVNPLGQFSGIATTEIYAAP